MSTGFTVIIEERDDVTLNEFVWRCARGFGALIMMREKPLDSLIPEKFVPDNYHEKEIARVQREITEAEALSLEDVQKQMENWRRQQDTDRQESEACRLKHTIRYESMIAKVEAWTPPTPDHEELKKFMLDQLRKSIPQDRGFEEAVVWPNFEEYKVSRIKSLRESIAYHAKKYAEELKRTQERNVWVDALRGSVGEPPR